VVVLWLRSTLSCVSIQRGLRRTALLAYACACVLLVGYFVARVQAFIVFERLMTGEQFRSATRLEAPLLWSALAALCVGLLVQATLALRSIPLAGWSLMTSAIFTALAFAVWYAVAVAQWWQIVDVMTVPHSTRRDPTPLENLLLVGLVGALVLSAALGIRTVSRSRAAQRVLQPTH
jgi:hypothetical protein